MTKSANLSSRFVAWFLAELYPIFSSTKRIDKFIALCIVCLTICSFQIVIYIFQARDYAWSIDEISETLGATLPDHLRELQIEGHQGLAHSLHISFYADPIIAETYARQFCSGTLYQSYDPFNAVDVATEAPFAHPIQLYIYSYYSYSSSRSDNVWGNRCMPNRNRGAYLQVRLTQLDLNSSRIEVELFYACDACRDIYPSNSQ